MASPRDMAQCVVRQHPPGSPDYPSVVLARAIVEIDKVIQRRREEQDETAWDIAAILDGGTTEGQGCHAAMDGDCDWSRCPQVRDGEPAATGRDCPLWVEDPEA